MIHIPVLRWGEPYKSLEVDKVIHFGTGEVLAEVSRANAALVERDMRHAKRARDVLRAIPIADLLQMMKKAGDLYAKAELPLGDGTQTPDQLRACSRRRPACPSTCADSTWRKISSCCTTWTRFSIR